MLVKEWRINGDTHTHSTSLKLVHMAHPFVGVGLEHRIKVSRAYPKSVRAGGAVGPESSMALRRSG